MGEKMKITIKALSVEAVKILNQFQMDKKNASFKERMLYTSIIKEKMYMIDDVKVLELQSRFSISEEYVAILMADIESEFKSLQKDMDYIVELE